MPFVKPARKADVQYVLQNLRTEDKQELEAAGQFRASGNIWAAFATHPVLKRVRPFLVFGVELDDTRANWASPWLLATPEVESKTLWVAKESRRWLDYFFLKYHLLQNVADIRNTGHLRWIAALGFSLGDTIELNGLPFRHFYMRREEYAHVSSCRVCRRERRSAVDSNVGRVCRSEPACGGHR